MDGIIVINKPAGMTSHDVIMHLRRKYKQKKFGHTGTLDPEATGVLVVLAGKACKALQFLEHSDKSYQAAIQLGTDTDTDDIFGNVTVTKPVNRDFDFQQELDRFKGNITQRIPMTSAKKVNGKKLMDYQRQGLEIEPQYKEVEVYDIQALDDAALEFKVDCSSGTFVRAICRDLAHHTGNAGCMKSLVRTAAGGFDLSQAQDLEAEHTIYPIEAALTGFEQVRFAPVQDIYNGKRVHLDTQADRVLMMDGEKAIAVYDRDHGDVFACARGLF